MTRGFQRFAFHALLILLSLSAMTTAAFFAYGDKIQDALIEELNKQLNAQVNIDEVSWSIANPFPELAVHLKGVRISEAGRPEKTLLRMDHLQLALELGALLERRVIVKTLRLKNGRLNMVTYPNGEVGYDIMPRSGKKPNEKPQGDKQPIEIQLKKIVLEQMTFHFNNALKNQQVELLVKRLDLSGAFDQNHYGAVADLEGKLVKLRVQNQAYLRDFDFAFHTDARVDRKKGIYHVEDATLRALHSEVSLKGNLREIPNGYDADLAISSPGLDLEGMLKMVPERYLGDYQNFEARGQLAFGGTLKGALSPTQNPVTQIQFDLEEGYIARKDLKALAPIRNLTMKGRFESTSSQYPQGRLQLEPFGVQLGEDRLSGFVRVHNFSKPRVQTQLKGGLKLHWLSQYIRLPLKANLEGTVKTDATIHAHRLDSVKWNIDQAEGYLTIKQPAYLPKEPGQDSIRMQSLVARVNPNGARVVMDRVQWRKSKGDFKGNAPNLWQYLSGRDSVLQARGRLALDYLPLHELLGSPKGDEKKPLDFPAFLDAQLALELDRLQYDAFNARALNAALAVNDTGLFIRKLQAQTLDGDFALNGYLTIANADQCQLYVQTKLRDINLKKLMAETNNLGQEALREEHIHGRLNASLQLSTPTDPYLKPERAAMQAALDFDLKDGALKDFPPLVNLIGFLKPKTLQNLRFYTLKGNMYIEQDSLFMGHLAVNSSALDIEVEGAQSLETDELDYHAKVRVSTLLRDERSDGELFQKVVKDDQEMYAFLKMTGTIDKPKVAWDKKRTGQQIKKGLADEGQELRDAAKELRRRREARQRRRQRARENSDDLFSNFGDKLKKVF